MADIFVTLGMAAGGPPGASSGGGGMSRADIDRQYQESRRREIEQQRELERHTRNVSEAMRSFLAPLRREIGAGEAAFSLMRLRGFGAGAAGLAGIGAAGAAGAMHMIQAGRAAAEQSVPTAFPGLAIQREYAERDKTAAIGRGLVGTFQSQTAAERAKADFLASTPGQEILKTWSTVASIPSEIKRVFYEFLTPAGQQGRSAGLAPDPRLGHFFGGADDLYRAVTSAALTQGSPQMLLTEIRDELRKMNGRGQDQVMGPDGQPQGWGGWAAEKVGNIFR